MLRLVLVLPLMLVSIGGSATGYTWGDLEDWMPRLAAAEEFLDIKDTEAETKFDANKRASAMMVYGFIHGISDGYLIDHWARLKFKYGEDIPNEKLEDDRRSICFGEPYFELIPKLIKFVENGKYNKNEEFAIVFLAFAMQEYKCK